MNILKFYIFFGVVVLLSGCNKNFKEAPENNMENTGTPSRNSNAIMELSYDIKTSRSFELPPYELSDVDLSMLNPSNEKQHVDMELLTDGQMHIIIYNLDFDNKIKINHHILPDDSPQVYKTEIFGNKISLYDKKANLLAQEDFDFPNQLEKVKKIQQLGNQYSPEEINSTLASMQGQAYIENLNEYIEHAEENGATVLEQGETYVTVRTSFKQIDTRIDEEVVMLIDKRINKMVGSRIYGKNNELLQSIYYGYNTGDVQSLNAIRIEQKIKLPSGKDVNMIQLTKIENLEMNINN